jgi:hypothetical protein
VADTAQEIVIATEAAPPPALATSPMELLSRALERGADLAMVEKLMDLAERQDKLQARRAYDEAIAAAKAEIPIIRKNRQVKVASKNGGADTNYVHEDLAEIARVVTPILSRHGLSYRFRTHYEPNQPVSVTCIISHKLGYSEENTLPGPPDNSGNKNSLQAIGSTCTYLQRMTLKAALGLAAAADDDDGQAAGGDEAISEEQLQDIRTKLDASGADIEAFCRYLKVEALPDIRAKNYPAALAAIAKKMKAAKSGASK